MFKILLALLFLTPCAWGTQWRAGTGENTLLGTSQAALIGTNSFNSIVQPLDNLLAIFCNQYIIYKDSSDITVSAGSVTVSNSTGSIRLMLYNSAPTTINWSNLDTGLKAANTTYYIYAVGATSSSTTATYFISASNTAPSGQTFYLQIASFATDGSQNITNLANNWVINSIGVLGSKSPNVIYQALTDVFAGCYANPHANSTSVTLETGSISGSMTAVQVCGFGNSSVNMECAVNWYIRKGDFYEFVSNATGENCFAVPTSK